MARYSAVLEGNFIYCNLLRALIQTIVQPVRADGRVGGYSLNKRKDAYPETGLFMSDAAAAYAALALSGAN